MGCGVMNRATDELETFIPGASDKTRFSAPTYHGMCQSAEGLELLWAEPSQAIQVGRSGEIECRDRVQPERLKSAHAQVDAINDAVTKSIRSQGTDVTYSVIENRPGVGEFRAVFP